MKLKMKKIQYFASSLKNLTLRVGGSRKTNLEWGLPKKGGHGQFSDLREVGKNKRVMLLRGF